MAGEAVEVSLNLKEALIESLNAVLSPDESVRKAAEQRIEAIEVTDDFGIYLTEFAMDPNAPLQIRQLASVLLRRYVETHWSSNNEKFKTPETPTQTKKMIRDNLPRGLSEPMSKVRSSIAYAISSIARTDWPEDWPELFDILMQAVRSNDTNAVHGAMKVMAEFCAEITDNQMPTVAPKLFPELYRIFTNVEVYSVRTRSRAIAIFRTCSELIGAMAQVDREAAKNLLFPVLPKFLEAFIHSLELPTDGVISDCGLKTQVVETFICFVDHFPRKILPSLNDILVRLWKALTETSLFYTQNIINDGGEEQAVDSDGRDIGVGSFLKSIFEFIELVIDNSKFKNNVRNTLTDLMYYLETYMMITVDQVEKWSKSPDQFLEDEDEDTFSYSVRISAKNLLLKLCEEFPDECTNSVNESVLRHVGESSAMRDSGNETWWKKHEAVMLTVGLVHETVKVEQLHLERFMNEVVLNDLGLNVSPYLLGRCLWVSSRYSKFIPDNLLSKLLEATVTALAPEQGSIVRVMAARAVYYFALDERWKEKRLEVMKPYLLSLIEGLRGVALTISSNETLVLVLDVFAVVLDLDKDLTATTEEKVTPFIMAVLLKYARDFMIVSLCQDNLRVLLANEKCSAKVEARLLPTLASIMEANASDDGNSSISTGLQAVAIDILNDLVRNISKPLSEMAMNRAFPGCIKCAMSTDDNTTLQNVGECLRAYLSEAYDQVVCWQDGEGRNGIYYVVQVITKLLDPKNGESSASFVGKLLSLLITKSGGELGEHLDMMLRAVLLKLQQAETLTVVQSLVLVFAVLMHKHLNAILEFLSSVPGPMGESALEFVLNEWCAKQHFFVGAYDRKVSILALCSLLEHAITTDDKRLQRLSVKGDRIESNDGIRTRSRSSNEQWTQIPVLVKIYKLLINELSSILETKAADDNDDDWDDEDEEDLDTSKASREFENDILAYADKYNKDLAAADDEDPDAKNDPLYSVDLQEYLTRYLQTLSANSCYPVFAEHHTQLEVNVLKKIGIQV